MKNKIPKRLPPIGDFQMNNSFYIPEVSEALKAFDGIRHL
jgi:hypothetical protein